MKKETVLFRQAHPNFVPDGKLSSQAFMPFPKDNGKPSVYDGDQISASESYEHYAKISNYESDSVWGVTCDEVSTMGLSSVADPLEHFPSHALIDFTSHPEKHYRKFAKLLKVAAVARGCLHSPA